MIKVAWINGENDGVTVAGLTDTERQAMRALAWWTVEEMSRTTETIFPVDLCHVVKGLLQG